RRFIRHQFCDEKDLSPRSSALLPVVRHAMRLPRALRDAFFQEYPELAGGGADTGGRDEGDGLPETGAPPAFPAVVAAAAAPLDAASIAALYPRREAMREAVAHITRHLGDGADPQAMADGTRAIAAVIRQLPSGHLNAFVP